MQVQMDYNFVKNKLIIILVKLLGRDITDIEICKESLVGPNICFSARELIYFLFEIEKEFSLHISEEDIAEGKFISIDSIAKIICKDS